MIDKAQHKIITKIMEMLESLDDEDFEKARMTIDIALYCRELGCKVGRIGVVHETG